MATNTIDLTQVESAASSGLIKDIFIQSPAFDLDHYALGLCSCFTGR
jgi:hypothetical protein